MTGALNTIFVKDMEIDISIGVNEDEKFRKQRVRLNVVVEPAVWPHTDNIEETLSYNVIIEHIYRLTKDRHIGLVETLAEDIAHACLLERVRSVTVRVEKPDVYSFASVGVEITRTRQNY